jgi:hypothetical protein
MITFLFFALFFACVARGLCQPIRGSPQSGIACFSNGIGSQEDILLADQVEHPGALELIPQSRGNPGQD